jgi:DNA-binding transcriptional ArsR family regulator
MSDRLPVRHAIPRVDRRVAGWEIVEIAMDESLIALLKALADGQRLRMLEAMARSDHSVEDLARLTGLAAPTVSRHLKRLREAGLAGRRRAGKHRDHFLKPAAFDPLLAWVQGLQRARSRPEYAAAGYREEVLQRFMEDEERRLPTHPRKRELVLDWLAQLLSEERFYRREELMRLWSPYILDWEALLVEMEQRGRISGNGHWWMVARP